MKKISMDDLRFSFSGFLSGCPLFAAGENNSVPAVVQKAAAFIKGEIWGKGKRQPEALSAASGTKEYQEKVHPIFRTDGNNVRKNKK